MRGVHGWGCPGLGTVLRPGKKEDIVVWVSSDGDNRAGGTATAATPARRLPPARRGGGCLRDLLLVETGCCLAEALGCGPQLLLTPAALRILLTRPPRDRSRAVGLVRLYQRRIGARRRPAVLPADALVLRLRARGPAGARNGTWPEDDGGPAAAVPPRWAHRRRPGPSGPAARSPAGPDPVTTRRPAAHRAGNGASGPRKGAYRHDCGSGAGRASRGRGPAGTCAREG